MAEKVHKNVYVIFVSLLLDLLAFTMILPLLPSLLDHYRMNDHIGLYPWLSKQIKIFQLFVGAPDKYNSVLFGGFLGSMFSFLQFIASPIFGELSDIYGRKPILIICLSGILISNVLWSFSINFAIFILARICGGISKGNVSLSMAIITDISSVKTRGIGMTLVGIAFSIGFIVGPLIGAIFAVWAKTKTGNWFIIPASFATFLAFADLMFVVFAFKETLPKEKRNKSIKIALANATSVINLKNLFDFKAVSDITENDKRQLKTIGLVYFVYLFIYSGLEFTLTFLTHHVFNYTSMEQGWMFCSIGVVMAMMQGGYVRRIPATKIKYTAILGLWIIIPSFVCVALANGPYLLYFGLFLFAVSTALIHPCLMTMASIYGAVQEKGTVMGIFRSLGALARALGPIFASIAFWSIGSTSTYLLGSVLLLWPVLTLKRS